MRVRTALWSHYLHIGFFSSSLTFHFFFPCSIVFFSSTIVVVTLLLLLIFFPSPSISLFASIVHFYCSFPLFFFLLLVFIACFHYSILLFTFIACLGHLLLLLPFVVTLVVHFCYLFSSFQQASTSSCSCLLLDNNMTSNKY